MDQNSRVAVVGSGSWATAIVKILHETQPCIDWYVRRPEMGEYIRRHGHNPQYLSDVHFNLDRIRVHGELDDAVRSADTIFMVVPSAFLGEWLKPLSVDLSGKFLVTSIKGIVPEEHVTATEFLKSHYGVSYSQMGVVSGPCHAEEVALERLSYITVSCKHRARAKQICKLIGTDYIRTIESTDIYGTEYSAILKNIYAVAVGVANGLGYGDNFQAVLTCNAQAEIVRFLHSSYPDARQTEASAYLGDLLVTCYSQFSRNRTFGTMIGKGYSVLSAQMEMKMVAEGYYATGGIHAVNLQHGVHMPIAETMHRILYEGKNAKTEMRRLTEVLV